MIAATGLVVCGVQFAFVTDAFITVIIIIIIIIIMNTVVIISYNQDLKLSITLIKNSSVSTT